MSSLYETDLVGVGRPGAPPCPAEADDWDKLPRDERLRRLQKWHADNAAHTAQFCPPILAFIVPPGKYPSVRMAYAKWVCTCPLAGSWRWHWHRNTGKGSRRRTHVQMVMGARRMAALGRCQIISAPPTNTQGKHMPSERIQRLLDTADQTATIEDLRFILTLDEDDEEGGELEDLLGGKDLVDPPHPNKTIAALLVLTKAKPDVYTYVEFGDHRVSVKLPDLAGKITIGEALNLRRASVLVDWRDESTDLLF